MSVNERKFVYEVFRKIMKHLNSDLTTTISFSELLEEYKNKFGEAEYNNLCEYLKNNQ